MAAGDTHTVPFCGSCGFELTEFHSVEPVKFCDACGADLTRFGFGGLIPPTEVAAAGGSLQVVFTFTANPNADSTRLVYTIDGGDSTTLESQTSPVTVVAAEDELVCAVIQSVSDGLIGPSTPSICDTATA